MRRYFKAISESNKDPVTGEYDTTGYIMLGAEILFAPILAPMFYIGIAAEYIQRRDEDG